jgi:hypothetical protein
MNAMQRIDEMTDSDEMFANMVETVFGDDIFVRTDNTVIRGGFAYSDVHVDGFVNVMAVAS